VAQLSAPQQLAAQIHRVRKLQDLYRIMPSSHGLRFSPSVAVLAIDQDLTHAIDALAGESISDALLWIDRLAIWQDENPS